MYGTSSNKLQKMNSNKIIIKRNNNKNRKGRTRFTKDQLIQLENEFCISTFVKIERMGNLVSSTGLDSQIIKVSALFENLK